jgi:hypothetical protein
MTAKGNGHDNSEYKVFARDNSNLAACWASLSQNEREFGSRERDPGYYIAQTMEYAIKSRLFLPLPPIGEPFQVHRFAVYDYYGNLIRANIDGEHQKWKVDKYDGDVDNIHSPYFHYFSAKIRYPMDENRTLLPMSRYHDTVNIFNRLYGGFDFDALMRMFTTTPKHFEEQNAAYDAWVDEEFGKFFSEFCEYAEIHPSQIPHTSYRHMRDNFHFNMDKYMFNDYLDFMNYPVGVELRDGKFYEMTGTKLFQDWATGHAIKGLAAGIAGMQGAMDDAFSGRKRGFIEKMLNKRAIEQHRRSMAWTIYPNDKIAEKFSVLDVVRFYPAPPRQPVPNPLL